MTNQKVMKNYLIKLTIHIGGYEKHVLHFIQGETEQKAIDQALRNESHNDDAGYNGKGEWWDDDMVYKVDGVRELSDHEFETANLINSVYARKTGIAKYTSIDVAEQQLLGFKSAKGGDSIIDLVDAMGLSLNELEILIKLYPTTLSGEDITSIREYLTGET